MTDVQELTKLSKALIEAARAYETARNQIKQEQHYSFVSAHNVAAEATREYSSSGQADMWYKNC